MKERKSKLAEYLHRKRVELGLTQSEVAEFLGYSSPQFISNWERGVAQPPVNVLPKLAKFYKVHIDDIFEIVLETTLAYTEDNLRRQFFRSTKARKAQ